MITFREVELKDAPMILDWRNAPHVASQMLTTISSDIAKQRQWILTSCNRQDYYHWIVQHNDLDIAFISLNKFNDREHSAEVGFYVGNAKYSYLTNTILHICYYFLFIHMMIDKLAIAVFEGNIIAKLHQYSGYEREPFLDIEVTKDGMSKKLLGYVLEKSNFLSKHPLRGEARLLPVSRWNCRPHFL